jgi:hypothetical protein
MLELITMKKLLYFGLLVVLGIFALSQGVMAGNPNANVTGTLAGQISFDIGNTSMGAMGLGNNYNDTSFFAFVNATGNSGWQMSVQDNDTALAYKLANPLSVGSMTNWSAATNYVSPYLTRDINVSGTNVAGPYIGLTGSAQQIATGGPGFRVLVPVVIKQTVVGGDPQVVAPYTLRVVIKFTGSSN